MTNSSETDRGVSSPRIISIPGSRLDVETKRLRQEIKEELDLGPEDVKDFIHILSLVEQLAKLEDW